MAPSALDKAVAKRDAIKINIQRIDGKVTDHSLYPLSLINVTTYEDKIQKAQTELEALLGEILGLILPDDLDTHKAEFTNLVDLCDTLTNSLHGIKANLAAAAPPPGPTTTHATTARLPRLDLKPFDGNLLEWSSFRDMFDSAVHNNVSVPPVQKLIHLKTLLRGEAARQIQSIVLTEANYDTAWKQLAERYQNDREILFSVLKRFFGQGTASPTSSAIRSLIDTSKETTRSLEILNLKADKTSNALMLYTILSKLDPDSRQLWEQNLKGTAIPDLATLYEFLEQRARALAVGGPSKPRPPRHEDSQKRTAVHFSTPHSRPAVASTSAHSKCKCCLESFHPLFKCSKFHSLSINERYEVLKKGNLCFNCFGEHNSNKCSSHGRCRTCQAKHHTLLHSARDSTDNSSSSTNASNALILGHHAREDLPINHGLLATAIIRVAGSDGKYHSCRAFLDGGAQSSFISAACADRLGLQQHKTNTEVYGLASCSVGKARGVTSVNFIPHFPSSELFQINALVLPKVTSSLPTNRCDPSKWSHLQNLTLADPQFNVPTPVDILLGSDIFWSLLMSGRKLGPHGSPVATESSLGWLVAGSHKSKSQDVRVHAVEVTLDQQLEKFWDVEEAPASRTFNPDESRCEEHFESTHTRNSEGRFTVSLPFRDPTPVIGQSRDAAMRRFKSLEKRLQQNPDHQAQYALFMKEYEDMGHMSLVQPTSTSLWRPQETTAISLSTRQESTAPSLCTRQESTAATLCSSPAATATNLRGPKESTAPVYFIPHHFVLKEDSTTTKFRVVFDASARTSTSVSLNDTLLVGPTLQDPLTDIIMRFRTHPIAFTADIAKMYRQIQVAVEDQSLQHILWRPSPDIPIQEYKLNTVTYGTASAPYLAVKCLRTLANSTAESFPLGSRIALNDFYVDDVMSGGPSVQEAIQMKDELLKLTNSGCFPLRKWSSNSLEFMASVPEDLRESNPDCDLSIDPSVKTLGIRWNTRKDQFQFQYKQEPMSPQKLTKRVILSEMSKLFDPIGWLAPIIIAAKIFMQDLWKLQLSWDDPVPDQCQDFWTNFKSELTKIDQIKIPRCIIPYKPLRLELAGFCDASEKAYAAVVYLCAWYENDFSASLITSKTRVAPTKTISLPRLELCGAVLLAKLIKSVQPALNQDIQDVHAWTDSTVVLAWINRAPADWKTFVANRITKIQANIPKEKWHHVPGTENPADVASRGIPTPDLINFSLWWTGPSWLSRRSHAPSGHNVDEATDPVMLAERRKEKLFVAAAVKPEDNPFHHLMTSKSSLRAMTRITAFVLRFITNCKKRINSRCPQPDSTAVVLPGPSKSSANSLSGQPDSTAVLLPGPSKSSAKSLSSQPAHTAVLTYNHVNPINPDEFRTALHTLAKLTQQQAFAVELSNLHSKKPLSKKSPLGPLSPFLDPTGLIRVGGRLRNATISPDQKNPILLPRNSRLTDLLIASRHIENLHAGPSLLLFLIQTEFWIIRGRDAIRFQLKKCVTCTRHAAQVQQQYMADLPASRLNPCRAFQRCGVDYAGPFVIRPDLPRSKVSLKAYLCLFVCFTTRAFHLEVVSSLSTDAFLAALRRFTSRRGRPTDIYSDCGTNFVGANRELKELWGLVKSTAHNQTVADALSSDGIKWTFNPPGAPHFGGLWEAGVKSVKFHMKRIVGNYRFTFEELTTWITQIEACLNSRPLTPCSSDPNDLSALTSGHFLIGQPLLAIPEPDLTSLNTSRMSRWQVLQQFQQQFWKRWSREYLSRLQQRPKWLQHRTNIQVDDLVLIKDENLPPLKWKLARVIQTHPDHEGIVRVTTLRTADGIIKRPIHKLCLLASPTASEADIV